MNFRQTGDVQDTPSIFTISLILMTLIILSGFFTPASYAQFSLPKIINNGMIIQRGVELPLRDSGRIGTDIIVQLNYTDEKYAACSIRRDWLLSGYGKDQRKLSVTSGVYIVILKAGVMVKTQKVLLMQ